MKVNGVWQNSSGPPSPVVWVKNEVFQPFSPKSRTARLLCGCASVSPALKWE